MDLTFNDSFELVPEWNGNKNDANPITITCRYLNTLERGRMFETKNVVVAGEYRIETVIHKEELVKTSVEKIANLKVNGEEIKTGAGLVKVSGLSALAEEVANQLYIKNMTGDLKN